MQTLNALIVIFGPFICLATGYVLGRLDERKEHLDNANG